MHKGSKGNMHHGGDHNLAHMLDTHYQEVYWEDSSYVRDMQGAARGLLAQVEQRPEACAAALGVALQQ
jgi:hypothetical protein